MNNTLTKSRDIWVDNIKVIACVLVLLGHFFQSMVKSDLMAETNLYLWFNRTIYYFHVPLFFIASGYLYQKYSNVDNLIKWKNNIVKKLIALGIPYFTFSLCAWLLKVIFSKSVNNEATSLLDALFINPSAPYWYLYALFFLFVVTPTFKNVKTANKAFIIAIFVSIISPYIDTHIYAVNTILTNEIWFMFGICFAMNDIRTYIVNTNKSIIYGVMLGIIFLIVSIIIYVRNLHGIGVNLLMGVLACLSIKTVIINCFKDNKQNLLFGFLAKYTMPIFVMHTMFAAAMRIILLKLNISSLPIHIVLGIAVSIAGPVIAAIVMERTVVLEFFLYPNKLIKARNKKNENIDG